MMAELCAGLKSILFIFKKILFIYLFICLQESVQAGEAAGKKGEAREPDDWLDPRTLGSCEPKADA